MAAIAIFRGLVLASFAVFAADVALGVMAYFGPELPATVQSYLDEQNAGTLTNVFSEANMGTQIAVGVLMLLYFVAYFAALIGLLGFRGWARWLFVVVVTLTVIFTASGGTSLLSPFESLASMIGFMVDGAILTLLFIEPIRARFRSPAPTPEQEPPVI